jgi:hypothetical protein
LEENRFHNKTKRPKPSNGAGFKDSSFYQFHLCPPRKPPNQAVFRLFIGFLKVAETAKNLH